MRKNYYLLIGIFLVSVSSLSYEITLIRTFSITLWYHFAFMVISIAMLGIGASGTLLSVYPRLRNLDYLSAYFLLFGLSIPLSYTLVNAIPLEPVRLSWDRIQLLYISLYYLTLSLPFFSFGLIISTAFSTMSGYARHIYGADLTGAGIGSILTLWLLSTGGPEKVVLIISLIAFTSLFICGKTKMKILALLLLCCNLVVLYAYPSFFSPKISPYKALETSLRFPGAEHLKSYHSPFSRVDVFKSPAVRYAPGISLKYLDDLPEQTGIAEDAGTMYAITHPGVKAELDFIGYLPSSLPYELSHKKNVLILDPKGGLSVLTAEYYDSDTIYKVDANPLLITAAREYLEGSPYDIYKENTWSGLGRSWLSPREKQFDLIDLSLTGPVPSASFGFSEDYRFTVEAFEEYIGHLTPDGLLSVTLFIIPPPRTEFRLINNLTAACERLGLRNIKKHIAAVRSWGTLTVILKKTELTMRDISRIKGFAERMRFDLVFYPGITAEETNIYIRMPSNEYFDSFQRLLHPATREDFNRDYLFDISVVHDENPFFHYFLKIKNAREIYRVMGEKWQFFVEEGYLLPVVLLQVLMITLVLILLPRLTVHKKRYRRLHIVRTLSYFAFLGIGFMFVEISLIQKMILPLENPSYAAAAVLSSLLISSGLGSFLSTRLTALQNVRVILVLSLIIFLYSLLLPTLMNTIHAYPIHVKIISVFFILIPAGILMGIPFPLGLSLLSRFMPELIPWAWAVNGCFSVLAPILAIMCALSIGFKMVIMIGVLTYLLAYAALCSRSYRLTEE